MMELTEQLIVGAAGAVGCGEVISYQGVDVDLTPPWRRVPMHELACHPHRPTLPVPSSLPRVRFSIPFNLPPSNSPGRNLHAYLS